MSVNARPDTDTLVRAAIARPDMETVLREEYQRLDAEAFEALNSKQNQVFLDEIQNHSRWHHRSSSIRPHRGGWQVFEASGVQPYFGSRTQAVDYAIERGKMRKGEIRMFDADGELLETFPFDDFRAQIVKPRLERG